jgi:aldose 1-epimerase
MKFQQEKIYSINGNDIHSITFINDNNFKITFYTYGGYIHEVHIPLLNQDNKSEDVLLGYGNIEGVLESHGYFNSIVGRVANRIGSSKFNIGNNEYKLYPNVPPNHLHGGNVGFNKKIWQIENINEASNSIKCSLKYLSPDMEENYPGNLDCTVTYELNNNNELLIEFHAISDQDTIVNLTNHNYWNFHGHGDKYQNNEDHVVHVNSKSICETDDQSIPTGKILEVDGTKFNLQKDFLISDTFLRSGGIDHNYVLQDQSMNEAVATIYSKKTGLGVEYFTNQNGIQFYTGNMMLDKYIGKYEKPYGLQYGMCLEPQHYPDAISHSNFPSPILRKNTDYLSKIKIKLRNDFLKN